MVRSSHRRSRGLTVIEILIVMGVISLMVGMVVVGFGASRSAEITRSVNQLGNLIRYGYDKARVTGDYYRLLIKFEERSFSLQAGDDRMYLPATDRDGKITEYDESKAQDQADRDRRAEDAFNQSVQAEVFADEEGDLGGEIDPYKAGPRKVPRRKPPLFEAFEEENTLTGLSKGFKLPDGVKIVSVRTDSDFEPIREGEASLYFFPRGRTQLTHILVEDTETEDSKWTIKVQPLTGRVTIIDGHEELTLPEDENDAEDELGKRRQRRTF